MSIRAVASLSIAALLLSACGGGQSQRVNPVPDAGTRHQHKGQVRMVVRIPRRKHLRPRYISAATKGMSFTFKVSGTPTLSLAVGLTPASNSGCTGYPSATMCTIELALPAGTYTFDANAYDRAPVSGTIPNNANLLSQATAIPITVTAGQNNTARLTLDGVPSQLAISNFPTATLGTPFGSPQPFVVTVKDASGETIVGAYANAVSLNDGDNSGATSIVTSGSDNPPAATLIGSSDSAAFNYDGSKAVAAITATSGTATSPMVAFVPSGVVNGVYANTDSSTGTNPGLCPGGAPGELRTVMCNAAAGSTIFFGCGNPCTIVLSAPLPPIAQNLTIDGGAFGDVIIDGASSYRAFYAQTGNVTLENLQIQNAVASGGAGAAGGGGGGAGLGGGIFVDAATVSLSNDYFVNDAAHGGAGANINGGYQGSGGGGGGMGAAGGGGGGGIVAAGGRYNGAIAFDESYSYGGGWAQSYGQSPGSPSLNPADYGGGGGLGGSAVGSSNSNGVGGAMGGFGGGGGGGGGSTLYMPGPGAPGGFGGGGGGGGAGGAGAGGGAASGPGGSLATISGGNADPSYGGGGAAAGPAVFVNTGSLTTTNSGASGSSVTAGAGGGGVATAGGTNATPVYNDAGTVNSSTATGGIAGALGNSKPSIKRHGHAQLDRSHASHNGPRLTSKTRRRS